MSIAFYKYHGTGNDFVMIDDRESTFPITNKSLVAAMCQRRFGIGADGLILLRTHDDCDFEMIYFNSDGAQSSMCGNGGRCIVAFAAFLGVIEDTCTFMAIDGLHHGKVGKDEISIAMSNVHKVSRDKDDYVLDTGSPHYVRAVSSIVNLDVKTEGAAIRYSNSYKEKGINVNFVERCGDILKVATYERGVEDETYSCGTGVVASAIAMGESSHQMIETKGGRLHVSYLQEEDGFTNIWLTGPTKQTFSGSWDL